MLYSCRGDEPYRSDYISVALPFFVPIGSKYIMINRTDYIALQKLDAEISRIKKECKEFGEQMVSTLVSLRTEKEVRKQLPEALQYIDFPIEKALPEPIYSEIRFKLQKAQTNGKQTE